MSIQGFTVDTHLLRELGDLLVGRDSTAILELVKNGYDADATLVRINAANLNSSENAVLTVEDNGNGMTAARFRTAFLRIAGRDKETGERNSPKFKRSYTGQKGIGRLASQKLATVLEVQSTPDSTIDGSGQSGVDARIDWELIDQQETLHELKEGLTVEEVPFAEGAPSGTILVMRSLKRKWTGVEVGRFIDELQSAQPPGVLLESEPEALALFGESLIGAPRIRTSSDNDPGFVLELDGDLSAGDDLWEKAMGDFNWCVEIEVEDGRARYQVTPTTRYVRQEPLAKMYSFEAEADPSLSFQARFYMMPKASNRRGPLKGFVRSASGIRVYLEGFRVLPYAEYGDDWLEIDRDYRSGSRYYTIKLDETASDWLELDKAEGLNAVASNGYFGAVFLTTSGAPGLESLINREGFVPGATFGAIRDIVQNGVRLSVRVRRSVFNQRQRLDAIPLASPPAEPILRPGSGDRHEPVFDPSGRKPFEMLTPQGSSEVDDKKIESAAAVAADLAARQDLTDFPLARDAATQLAEGFYAARLQLETVQGFQPELRILAGVGLQLGAFVHDVNGMLASATTVRDLLGGMLAQERDREKRDVLKVTLQAADELAHTLARQSSYLTDVLSADPRRRRSRVKVGERVDSVLRFLAKPIASKGVKTFVDLPPDLRTPPMFPAEVTILLSNLLTNAVKNAACDGNIWVDGRETSDSIEIEISNDGTSIDLAESERWFLPFESTTAVVDEALGQGLGLGLPIVRALTDDYRGDVRFVDPVHGIGTTVKVILPRNRKVS